jgi:hypothetical protein
MTLMQLISIDRDKCLPLTGPKGPFFLFPFGYAQGNPGLKAGASTVRAEARENIICYVQEIPV